VAVLPPLLAFLLVAPPASARVFPTPILVDDEVELRSLYQDGTLTEDDLELLLELLNDPVNINRARRNGLYDLPGVTLSMATAIVADRKANGPYPNVESLLRVPGMTADVVEQLLPYAEALPPSPPPGSLTGHVRAKSAWFFQPVDEFDPDHPNRTHNAGQLGYDRIPDSYLKGRFRYMKWLKVGYLGLAQDGLSSVAYDPESRDFYGSWGAPVFELGKVYAQAERGDNELVLGSYTTGFGVGLTFDSTNRTHPHGIYPDLTVTGTERFSLRKGQFGVAGRLGAMRLSDSLALDTTVFASTWRYNIYQYDLGVGGYEGLDPLVDETSSPRVYVETPDGEWWKGGWLTIPDAYQESVVGANSTLEIGEQLDVGATAYFGHINAHVLRGVEDNYELVLRSAWPETRDYGAVGVHASYLTGTTEFLGEFSQSLNIGGTTDHRGGQAALVKGIFDLGRGELETSLRHYGTHFDNPHARGLAAADEYGGQRDRDEQGARVKLQYEPSLWLGVRFMGEVWRRPSLGTTNMELYGRVEWKPFEDVSLIVLADHRNRDLANNGRTREYGGDYIDYSEYGADIDQPRIDQLIDESFEVIEGAGSKNYWGTQLKVNALPRTKLTAYYKRTYTDEGYLYPAWDDGYCDYWYMIGHYVWFKAQVKPIDATSITLRGRYEDEDVHGSKGLRYVEGYLQVDQKLPKRIKVGVRGMMMRDLNDPDAEFKDPCNRAGAPDLCGTCVCEDIEDTEETELKTKGMVWVTLDWRF